MPARPAPSALACCLLVALVATPLAGAEQNRLVAVGANLGWSAGVAGVQWDDDSAVGVRYWANGTSGQGAGATVVVTLCHVPDSGNGAYCERHRVAP